MGRVHRIEDDAFRWGSDGRVYSFEPEDGDSIIKAFSAAVADGFAAGEPIEGDNERQVARVLGGRLGLVQKDAGQGLCIAWFPFDGDADEDDAFATQVAALAPGGFKPEDIHITLLYLGEMDDPELEFNLNKIAAVTCLFADRWPTLEGCVSGLGRFVGDGDTDVFIALLDVPRLGEMRHCLKNELLCNNAIPWKSPVLQEGHGFVPHITLGYFPRAHASLPPLTETIPFCIESLTVAAGPDRQSFPLFEGGEPEDAVAAPYWAARDAATEMVGMLRGWSDWITTEAGHGSGMNADGSVWSKAEGVEFMARWLDEEGIAKAGRVFSQKNLDRMAELHDQIGAAHGKLGDLLDVGTPSKKRALPEGTGDEDAELEYIVRAADEEKRYTFGPLYAPNRKDAHAEYIKPDILQAGQWEYVRECVESGSNRINLQHGDLGDVQVGEWVDIVTWPYETTCKMIQADGSEVEVTLPAGTVYMGVVWDEDAYPLVKKGKINGYSLGGRAVKIHGTEDFDPMGWKTTKAAQHAFQDDGNGDCATCGESESDGNHTQPTAKATPAPTNMGEVEAIVRLGTELAETRAAKATLEAQAAGQGDLVNRLVDVFTKQAEQKPGDIHVHVPEQNVTIHESPGIEIPPDE